MNATKDELSRAQALHVAGGTHRTIADELGTSTYRVKAMLKRVRNGALQNVASPAELPQLLGVVSVPPESVALPSAPAIATSGPEVIMTIGDEGPAGDELLEVEELPDLTPSPAEIIKPDNGRGYDDTEIDSADAAAIAAAVAEPSDDGLEQPSQWETWAQPPAPPPGPRAVPTAALVSNPELDPERRSIQIKLRAYIQRFEDRLVPRVIPAGVAAQEDWVRACAQLPTPELQARLDLVRSSLTSGNVEAIARQGYLGTVNAFELFGSAYLDLRLGGLTQKLAASPDVADALAELCIEHAADLQAYSTPGNRLITATLLTALAVDSQNRSREERADILGAPMDEKLVDRYADL